MKRLRLCLPHSHILPYLTSFPHSHVLVPYSRSPIYLDSEGAFGRACRFLCQPRLLWSFAVRFLPLFSIFLLQVSQVFCFQKSVGRRPNTTIVLTQCITVVYRTRIRPHFSFLTHGSLPSSLCFFLCYVHHLPVPSLCWLWHSASLPKGDRQANEQLSDCRSSLLEEGDVNSHLGAPHFLLVPVQTAPLGLE